MSLSRFFSLAAIALLLFAGACTRTTNTNVAPSANANATTAPSATNRTVSTNSAATNVNTGTTPVNTNTATPTLTVVVSRTGLQPAQPTVTAGTRVTFQNTDNAQHQIVSNPHPTHTGLPGFEVNLSPGESQSYTFSRIGDWGFHDHLDAANALFQGVVRVTS